MYRALSGSKLVAAAALWMCAGATLACPPLDERCKLSSKLVLELGYIEKLEKVQDGCRERAMAMRPEELARKRPAVMLGMQPTNKRWPEIQSAFENYAEEACGGPELLGLILEGYRIVWDRELPGSKLQEAVGGKLPAEEIAEKKKVVSASVNGVLQGLLEGMVKIASNNYTARIKGVVTGVAVDVAGGELCRPTEETEPGALILRK